MDQDMDLTWKVAVSMTPGINADVVRAMRDNGVTEQEFIETGMLKLSQRLGAGHYLRFEDTARSEALFRARKEVVFMNKHHIRGVYMLDEDYPPLLMELSDAPVLLYVLGEGSLNPPHALAVVGTRKASAYGLNFTKQLIADLAAYYPDMSVVSGLAYGIDAAGHNAAMEHGLETLAVVAHGLDMVYPAAHRELARRIVHAGGAIVSEYPTGTTPYQRNFLERNRIVAGLCEATFVAESEVRGGAMSTANQAFQNNRDVMALPGRAGDTLSSGCNHLIRSQKAQLITCAADVVQLTGWAPYAMQSAPRQRNLFPELSGPAAQIYSLMRHESAALTIDVLHQRTGISIKDLMPVLTEMEFDGIITRLPGSRYQLG